jgi:hypothetical protein
MVGAEDKRASLTDLTQAEVEEALRRYCAHELTTSDLEDMGFQGLPDIVGHLNRLGLKMPNKPVELESAEVAALRQRGMTSLRESIRASETVGGVRAKQAVAGSAKR